MPKMLTVDAQFEAIVAGVGPVVKMTPYRETDPEPEQPREGQTSGSEPAEEETTEDE